MGNTGRELDVPSDMSQDGREGKLTAENFDQEFKKQIREKVVELIIKRAEVNYEPGTDVLKKYAQSWFRYRIPYIFDVAKSLLKGDEPQDFEDWDWENYHKMAEYNVDGHTKKRWQSQRNSLFRRSPSLLQLATINWKFERNRLSYAEWEERYIPNRTEGIEYKGFYQI